MHLQTNAVAMCNQLANQMRGQGKSNKWIFGMDHHVTFEARANYEWNVSGPGSDDALFEVSWPHEFKVRCAKWGGAQVDTPDTLANAFHVKKATMKLEEKALKNGYCAVKLTTAVSTNTANKTFKYRYKHSSGKLSPVYSAKTKGNKIAVVTHTWVVPNKNGLERGWMQLIGVSHDFKSNRARYRMKCVDAPGGFAPNPQKPKVRVPLGGNGKLSN